MADIAQSLDFDSYWMPFSGNRQFKADPRLIVAADGCHYTDAAGRRIFDSLSGLWCTSFGHGRDEIASAIAKTAKTLDYAPPFQYAHPMAFELAERVRKIVPDGLEHVFFTNSGSESADTAIKIARAYWVRRGQPEKTRLIGREKGYHGVNVGGTGMGGIPGNKAFFGDMLATEHLPHTLLERNRFTRGVPEYGAELADTLEQRILDHGAETVAAVMVEPMSGSAGVIVPPAGYLKRLREICDRHDILLIFDEVLTGFGRLGATFGAELFGVTPDIMTLAKNLTNAAVPMGAVVTSDAIYDAFMDADLPPHAVELAHGYTYSAHPLACAAGLAAMDVFENERMAERAAELAPYFEAQLHALRGAPHVTDIRNLGMAGALEIETAGNDPTYRPWAIAMAAWERGMYLRFGGNTVQLGPPFSAERADIDFMCEVLDASIRSVD
ncbi:aminotransferase class III-fold pyridoxal phosphate-dependent enzyme [Salinisphaera sp. SWV1]|uniref:aminotransferase class III-fold pyridoxal phosphate-dependent enzyme n=1 Tax=Salinisphaera sp. SWV1 TaxID=3454139 RepID=UPI003F82414D